MSVTIVDILFISLLLCAGGVLVGLESGALAAHKIKAVVSVSTLCAGAFVAYFTVDSEGKIDWGDEIKAEQGEGGQKKKKKVGAAETGKGGTPTERDGKDGKQAQADLKDGKKGTGGGLESDGKKKGKGKGGAGAENDVALFDTFRDCKLCPLMVKLPKGEYAMGAGSGSLGAQPTEGPVTPVAIPKDFAVSRFEILRREFHAFVAETGYKPANACINDSVRATPKKPLKPTKGLNYRKPGFVQDGTDPVVCISWSDAKAYVRWLSDKTGGTYHLLTEAEWEYAARAGASGPFAMGAVVNARNVNFDRNWTGTSPTGTFGPNRFTLREVHGNVAEWVEDCWHPSLAGGPDGIIAWTDPNKADCSRRSVRGGSWVSTLLQVRSSARASLPFGQARNSVGLRVAKVLRGERELPAMPKRDETLVSKNRSR
ncbi:MAG: formylglycine-generating enzyme family protein [Pseudomonadota bacterium]